MRQDQELAVEGEESATIDGMTPEEMREWQRAFLALQGRGGGAATTGPLVRLFCGAEILFHRRSRLRSQDCSTSVLMSGGSMQRGARGKCPVAIAGSF